VDGGVMWQSVKVAMWQPKMRILPVIGEK